MNEFTLYWRTGERNVVKGPDVASAMTLSGYGGGAVRALDFWARGDDQDWEWNDEKREWLQRPNPATPTNSPPPTPARTMPRNAEPAASRPHEGRGGRREWRRIKWMR
jgi:hypothetical protein